MGAAASDPNTEKTFVDVSPHATAEERIDIQRRDGGKQKQRHSRLARGAVIACVAGSLGGLSYGM